MQIEYEATFPNINKDEIRERLEQVVPNGQTGIFAKTGSF